MPDCAPLAGAQSIISPWYQLGYVIPHLYAAGGRMRYRPDPRWGKVFASLL